MFLPNQQKSLWAKIIGTVTKEWSQLWGIITKMMNVVIEVGKSQFKLSEIDQPWNHSVPVTPLCLSALFSRLWTRSCWRVGCTVVVVNPKLRSNFTWESFAIPSQISWVTVMYKKHNLESYWYSLKFRLFVCEMGIKKKTIFEIRIYLVKILCNIWEHLGMFIYFF